MKKYVSGFLFFFCLTMLCLIGLYQITRPIQEDQAYQVQVYESIEQPYLAEDQDTMVHLVLNQESISHTVIKEKYCLVAEEGYLIVYDKELEMINLFTHMPVSEFPFQEQERLMEGIWFETMAEIFSYLESYSS